MVKEFIGTGKTIQEATVNARQGLNAPLGAQVEVQVISEPKKKILGLFGGSDAQVKASYDDGKKEKKPRQTKKDKAQSSAKQQSKKTEKKTNKKAETKAAPSAPVKTEDKSDEILTEKDIDLDYAASYLRTMLEGLKVEDLKINAYVADGVVQIDIECEDYGIIIGRRGETLDSLQYLTCLAIKNMTRKYVRVSLNVGDYRDKRTQTLNNLAVKMRAMLCGQADATHSSR